MYKLQITQRVENVIHIVLNQIFYLKWEIHSLFLALKILKNWKVILQNIYNAFTYAMSGKILLKFIKIYFTSHLVYQIIILSIMIIFYSLKMGNMKVYLYIKGFHLPEIVQILSIYW